MNTPAPRRLPRAVALAVCATVVGALSHVLSGGALTATGAVCALPVLTALAWPLTGRERGWSTILGVQLGGQQAAHLLFGLGAAPVPHTALPTDAWFYGHVVAAVAVASWLRAGERRAWAAARRAAAALSAHWRRLLVLFERPEALHPEPAPSAVDDPAVAPFPLLRHSVVRRGPPLPA